ncbi:MAG: sulfite exporter TauE/SafE family protein [Proteobacteria bacterium]|nr:sulfite exporter TauE/SafE family protein [Pseudomonadota bacterium]
MHDLLAILSGSLIGLILGLVGGGGSIIATPLLLYVVGMPSVHAAIGTSAAGVTLSALGNLLAAMRRGLVKWPCAIVFSASGMLGSYAGVRLALLLPGSRILFLFALLMIAVGMIMLLRKDAEGDPGVRLTIRTARRMMPWLVAIGFATGLLAGFFGIGGGFLIVPGLMLATGMPITYAIGTSLVAITAFGAVTAASHAWAGDVIWRDVGLFLAGGIAGSVIGQGAGRLLEPHKRGLQSVFASAVIAVGLFTLYRGLP